MTSAERYTSSGRTLIRRILKALAVPAFALLTELEITGQENLPPGGPLLVVGNHFSFIDPVCFVRLAPWPIEFLGGAHMPHAPGWARLIPLLWGYHPLYRGTGATDSLKTAVEILKRGGILAVFPEAGSWASVLRPARPGTALIATLSGAPILPVGLVGIHEVFPSLARRRRARIRFNIGKPFGPFRAEGRGRERRAQLDEIGHEIMRRIAELLPPERRGHYSEDPALREAARSAAKYPWADKTEGEVIGKI